MQYVDYQHMIVNEINEIYLVLILFTCIYKYHIFKLFPISYELSYKPIFSKQQCILISDLQITYTVQLTNSFEKSLIYLIYIQRLILIFQIFFIFFFIKFHKSICYMYLFIIAIFFFEIVQVSTLCTQNIFVTSRIVSIHIFATSHLKCIQLPILDFVLNILPE